MKQRDHAVYMKHGSIVYIRYTDTTILKPQLRETFFKIYFVSSIC